MIKLPIPTWLIELRDWVQVLTPIIGLLVVIFWTPLRNYCDHFFKEKITEPEEKQNEQIVVINSKLDEISRQIEDMKEIHRSLLHHEVFTSAKKAIEKNSITSMELQNLDELYQAYRDLGGNGMAERLYEEAKKLELK